VWNGVIPVGESLFISFRVKIGDVTSGTIITNQGTVYFGDNEKPTDDPSTPPADDPTNVTVFSPSLSITKEDSKDPVGVGETMNYIVVVRNDGDAPAYNVTITETYDINFEFISSSPLPDTGTDNVWTIGTILSGEEIVINITGRVLDAGETMLNNTVEYTSSNAGNGTANESTQVKYPSISIDKIPSSGTVDAGEEITYTITYSNPGDVELTNIIITDTYPEYTTFVSSSPSPSIDEDTWFINSLPPGSSGTITVILLVDGNAPNGTILINHVEITCDQNVGDMADAIVEVVAMPILSLSKADSPDPIDAGSELVYTITLSNNGNADATNVVVTDEYDNTMLVITDADGGVISGNHITWSISSLSPGDSISFNITATVKDTDVALTLYNFVNATCDEGAYAEDDEYTAVNPSETLSFPFLEILKEDNVDPVPYGGTIDYTITVRNIGDGDATNVVVEDVLGEGLQYISAQPSPDSRNGNMLLWNIPSLVAGGTTTIHVYAKAISFGVLINYANATCDEGLYVEDNETTTVINDTEPPHSRKVFHGTVYNVSMWDMYILHYIPKETYITLKSVDYPRPGASGVNHTYYRMWKMNDATGKWDPIFDWKEYHGEELHLYEMRGYGKYEIEFYSVDRVGNIEELEWNDVYVYQSEEEIPS